jgi:hypothetical protein
MFRFINPKVYYSPDDGNNGSSGVLDKQGIFDALDKDDNDKTNLLDDTGNPDESTDDKDKSTKDTKEKTKKTTEKDDEETEDDELEELEELIEEDDKDEPEEDELEQELIAPVSRKKILKEFPELFKKFPHIERALYKSQQYGELFPTLDDAREFKSKAETLDSFETDLANGDVEKILTATKSSAPNAFAKIVDNLITTINKVDPNASITITGNIISHTIYSMAMEARKTKNEALLNAASLLNQFVFGTSDYVSPKKLATEERADPEKAKLETERQQFLQDRFQVANQDLSSRVTNAIKDTIDSNIDPKGSMEDYVRKNASRDAFEIVNQMLVTDKRFQQIKDKLWERAAKNNFNSQSVADIRKAFLSRAKQLLPTAINKARMEALKGMRRKSSNNGNDTNDDDQDISVNKTQHSESRRSNNRPQVHDSKKPQKGESSLDFLMRDS